MFASILLLKSYEILSKTSVAVKKSISSTAELTNVKVTRVAIPECRACAERCA